MKSITIEIPDDLAHPAGASDEDVARDARLALAILWYEAIQTPTNLSSSDWTAPRFSDREGARK
jgi:hypothetical protein